MANRTYSRNYEAAVVGYQKALATRGDWKDPLTFWRRRLDALEERNRAGWLPFDTYSALMAVRGLVAELEASHG